MKCDDLFAAIEQFDSKTSAIFFHVKKRSANSGVLCVGGGDTFSNRNGFPCRAVMIRCALESLNLGQPEVKKLVLKDQILSFSPFLNRSFPLTRCMITILLARESLGLEEAFTYFERSDILSMEKLLESFQFKKVHWKTDEKSEMLSLSWLRKSNIFFFRDLEFKTHSKTLIRDK